MYVCMFPRRTEEGIRFFEPGVKAFVSYLMLVQGTDLGSPPCKNRKCF